MSGTPASVWTTENWSEPHADPARESLICLDDIDQMSVDDQPGGISLSEAYYALSSDTPSLVPGTVLTPSSLVNYETFSLHPYGDPASWQSFIGNDVVIEEPSETGLGFFSSDPPAFVPTIPTNHFVPPTSLEHYITMIAPDEDSSTMASDDFCVLLEIWSKYVYHGMASDALTAEVLKVRSWERPPVITRDELCGDQLDIQGIDWTKLGTTRDRARAMRTEVFRNTTRQPVARGPRTILPNTGDFFSFKRMRTDQRVFVPHFQLRHLLAATSSTDVYYAQRTKVMHMNPFSGPDTCVLDMLASSVSSSSSPITSLAASGDVLIAGGFSGEYALTNLSSSMGTKPTEGFVTHDQEGITNHIHLFNSRFNSSPQAVFCSNDQKLRVLDCYTNTFTHTFQHSKAVNCSATSPDGRLRVVGGDFHHALITDAESGVVQKELPAHKDDIFACAWADNGIHVATGAQDSQVVIWDARWWGRPLATIDTILTCPRSLAFTPTGSGKRVLFAAEADDNIHAIDAENFDQFQGLDFFGSIGGMSLTPDGSSLFVANCDSKFHGILEYERVDFNERFVPYGTWNRQLPFPGAVNEWQYGCATRDVPYEWIHDLDLDEDVRTNPPARARNRRGLDLGNVVV